MIKKMTYEQTDSVNAHGIDNIINIFKEKAVSVDKAAWKTEYRKSKLLVIKIINH